MTGLLVAVGLGLAAWVLLVLAFRGSRDVELSPLELEMLKLRFAVRALGDTIGVAVLPAFERLNAATRRAAVAAERFARVYCRREKA